MSVYQPIQKFQTYAYYIPFRGTEEEVEAIKWCEDNIGPQSNHRRYAWHYSGRHHRDGQAYSVFYIENKEIAAMFLLRWL